MNADDILNELKLIAEENGYELTENAEKIAKFRARAALTLDKCACCKLDTTKYCISERCKNDIETNGECGCHCFKKNLTSVK